MFGTEEPLKVASFHARVGAREVFQHCEWQENALQRHETLTIKFRPDTISHPALWIVKPQEEAVEAMAWHERGVCHRDYRTLH